MSQRYLDVIGYTGVEETRTPEEIKANIINKLIALEGGD